MSKNAKKPVKTINEQLSATSRKLLFAFDEASQHHGWESDQGSPHGAELAKKEWEEAKDKLERRLLALENRLKANKHLGTSL